MTLTEEQREAIRVISKLPMAIGCQLCHPYIMENYGSHFIVLRDMIDSSGTVEPTGGFDLERARGLRDFLQDDCAEVGDVWGEMIAEIERLRAENEEALESLTAAYLLGRHEKAQEKEGKIGPDARPPYWQITEERVGLLEYCLETLLDAPDIEEIPGPGHSIEVLRAMLTEAGQ